VKTLKKLVIIDGNNSASVDSFFSKFSEFSNNHDLAEQTARFLKVLLRHSEPENIDKITDKVDNGYSFSVSGVCRTYTVIFEVKKDAIVLKELY